MRLLAVILSLYLVLLGIMPCGDATEEHNHKEKIEAGAHSDHDSADEDLCSPFCSCSCCGVTLAFFSLEIQLPFKQAGLSEIKYPQSESQILQTSTSFWQPPKI